MGVVQAGTQVESTEEPAVAIQAGTIEETAAIQFGAAEAAIQMEATTETTIVILVEAAGAAIQVEAVVET